jgi:phospholipase/carboxylesterase
MNRIAFPAEFVPMSIAQFNSGSATDTVDAPRCRFTGEAFAPHATFAPMHYEAGYAYPLVVWLHGSLGSEQQLRRVMPLVSMRNYVAVAPRGTSGDRVRRGAFDWRQSDADVEVAEDRVFECVSTAARRYNVHPQRVFLVGLGSGGTMALRVAWNHPERFAGVGSIGGPLPADNRPLRNVNQLRQLSCFVATSRSSLAYPERSVCQDLRLLHSAGCTVALRQYPCGDELTTNMLADLDRWMMGLVCSPAQVDAQQLRS